MAVSESDLVVGPLVPAAGVSTISLDFFFEFANWLEVYRSGSDVPLILNVDYTVAGEGSTSGVVTLTTPANGEDSYSVYLVVPMERSSDMQLRGEFKSEPFNIEMDRLWQAMQGLRTTLGQTLRVSRTSQIAGPLETLSLSQRADRTIIFDQTGDGLSVGLSTTEISSAQGYATAASVSAYLAADKANLAQLWATEAEDVEVWPGEFSAFHWAAKSASSAGRAEVARDEAQGVLPDRLRRDVATLLADTTLTYTTGQPGTVVAGDIVRTLAEGFSYEVAASSASGLDIVENAVGVKLRVLRGTHGYSWAQWGVRPQQIGDTARAQQAIDFILRSGERELHAPAGHYVFTQLRMFNTPSDNPREQRDKMTVRGEGQLEATEVYRGTQVNDFYGTIIEIQGSAPADDGIILASGDTAQRNGILENLTVIYGGTGYALDMRYLPFHRMRNVSIRITSATGKVANIDDMWGALWDGVIALCDINVVHVSHGVRLAATIFAGNFETRNCQIDHFGTNLLIADGGAPFANIIMNNTWFQRMRVAGMRVEGRIWNLRITNGYAEPGVDILTPLAENLVKIASSGGVRNIEFNGLFMLGGEGTQPLLSGAMIDTQGAVQINLRGVTVFNPFTPILHARSSCRVKVDQLFVEATDTNMPTGPLDLFTVENGISMFLEVAQPVITDTPKIRICDQGRVALTLRDGLRNTDRSVISRGLERLVLNQNDTYDYTAQAVRPNSIAVVAETGTPGGNVFVRLLAAVNADAGAEYMVHNAASSVQTVVLRNGSDSVNIALVRPGQFARCIADQASGEYIIIESNTQHSDRRVAFTPTLIGATTAGTATYQAQVGEYIRHRDRVELWITLQWTGHTGTGAARISGLPVTSANNGIVTPGAVSFFGWGGSMDNLPMQAIIATSSDFIGLFRQTTTFEGVPVAASGGVRVHIVYPVTG